MMNKEKMSTKRAFVNLLKFSEIAGDMNVINNERSKYGGSDVSESDGAFPYTKGFSFTLDPNIEFNTTNYLSDGNIFVNLAEDVTQLDTGAWSNDALRSAVPSTHDQIMTDADSNVNQDLDLPQAEEQEDAAPSDPRTLTNLNNMIKMNMASENKNLDGGIAEGDHPGVEDANALGPDDLPDLVDFLPENPVAPQTQQQSSEGNNQIGNVSGNGVGAQLNQFQPYINEKSDFAGDIGQDTAVQSSLNVDYNKHISPYLPAPHVPENGNAGLNTSGVQANLNAATIANANSKLQQFESSIMTNLKNLNETNDALKTIRHEIMNIDNIVYLRDIIMTPEEKINKATNRIIRLGGVRKMVEDAILNMKDEDMYLTAPLVSLHVLSSCMIVLLDEWRTNPDSEEGLEIIENVVSPSIEFNIIAIEKAMARYESAVHSAFISYHDIIESYQRSDRSERDMSKLLKFDDDFSSPHYSPFAIRMKQEFNHQVNNSLLSQRKMRSHLNSFTMLSKMKAEAITNNIQVQQRTKQMVNTARINTDNALQKTPKLPLHVKTNSRRLNLLETPLAIKNAPSVFVNEYDRTKVLFG